ncbi:MAG: hypothetical protein WBA16_07285, partial [Nonlabens sp.]
AKESADETKTQYFKIPDQTPFRSQTAASPFFKAQTMLEYGVKRTGTKTDRSDVMKFQRQSGYRQSSMFYNGLVYEK